MKTDGGVVSGYCEKVKKPFVSRKAFCLTLKING
jgi:hypothetical protein